MKNGTAWRDDAGNFIQAHGGMIARFGDKWYWYGENKGGETKAVRSVGSRMDVIGISCYSSPDLLTWHYEGLALSARPDETAHPLHPSRVVERPKVIYCEKTGKYVMWFHADDADYLTASAGCAVAERPEGPFAFLHAMQPNRRDCRDLTIYRDPADGRTYLVHSGDWNHTLYFSQLTDDLTGFTGACFAQLNDQIREGAALCRHDGKYYCLTSGCTGWKPNPTLYAVTEHLNTPMRLVDNPCEGPNFRTTFDGQSTYIFEANGAFYLMLDHWRPDDLRLSGYSILPMEFTDGHLLVRWRDEFTGL